MTPEQELAARAAAADCDALLASGELFTAMAVSSHFIRGTDDYEVAKVFLAEYARLEKQRLHPLDDA
jgi:hypothetical protein